MGIEMRQISYLPRLLARATAGNRRLSELISMHFMSDATRLELKEKK